MELNDKFNTVDVHIEKSGGKRKSSRKVPPLMRRSIDDSKVLVEKNGNNMMAL